MKPRPYLRLVISTQPVHLTIGRTELEHLLSGHSIGFHVDHLDIKIEISPETIAHLDPPEAQELVWKRPQR